ncbi:MAG: hypothetical protein ACE5DX_01325 [Candidatus Dojkabacteria bacterium]
MTLANLKAQIRAVVFGIFGILVAIVLIRIILRLVGANPDASFVSFWYNISDFLVNLFRDIYPVLQANLLKVRIELFSVFALMFYVIAAFLVQKSFTSVADDDSVQILKNIIDALFKITEFLLITRFIFKLTGAAIGSGFVKFIYAVSAIVHEPFQGILPTINVGDFNIIFESSTLIAIVVIIIFDLVTEGIIDNLTGAVPKKKKPPQPVFVNPVPAAQPQQPQNITINVPQQPQQPAPQVVDRRQIHVVNPPPQPHPQTGQSHLEGQHPQRQLPPHSPGHGYRRPPPQPGQNAPRNPNTGGGYSSV